MSCLSFFSITQNLALASLNSNTNNNSPPSKPTAIPAAHKNPPLPRRPGTKLRPRQPSVIEIERAIGAGRFRDIDPRDIEEERKTAFDMSLMNFSGKFEGPVMKKLRETGEWVTDRTETSFRSSGKRILLFAFQWVLPIWVFALFVAAGVIKLPFRSPVLDDLLM